MDIQYYREFVTLMKAGSFTKAAEELYITQSSLSKHIRALEDEWKVQLVERRNRRIEPTAAGEIFLKHARRICAIELSCAEEMNLFLNQSERQVRIIGILAMAAYGVEDHIYEFSKLNPELKVIVESCSETLIQSLVSGGEADIGIMRECFLEEDETLHSEVLMEDHICIVVPETHRFADRERVSLEELTEETFFSRQEDNSVQGVIDQITGRLGIRLKSASVSIHTGFRNCLPYIEKGDGIMFGVRRASLADIKRGNYRLKTVDLAEEIPMNLCMVYRRENADRSPRKELIAYLKK